MVSGLDGSDKAKQYLNHICLPLKVIHDMAAVTKRRAIDQQNISNGGVDLF